MRFKPLHLVLDGEVSLTGEPEGPGGHWSVVLAAVCLR